MFAYHCRRHYEQGRLAALDFVWGLLGEDLHRSDTCQQTENTIRTQHAIATHSCYLHQLLLLPQLISGSLWLLQTGSAALP